MTDYDKNSSPRNYIVTLIDVLGQKEHLEKHRFLTETTEGKASLKTEDGQNKFKEIQEETYNKVLGLRRMFENALSIFGKSILNHPAYNTVPPEDQRIITNLAKPMFYQFFSDTIIIYAPLASKDELKMRYRIATTICACMSTMLIGFACGTFFRGGMEIGVGTEFPEGNGIYGLALNDAYHLENKVAGYPRIVVGNKLKELIQCKERKAVYSKYWNDINDCLDDFCNSLIIKDKDSSFIVDFLGKTFAKLSLAISTGQSQDYVGRGLVSIGDQYTKFLNDKSEEGKKISSRYELLKNYYFERLDNWGLSQTTVTLDDTQ